MTFKSIGARILLVAASATLAAAAAVPAYADDTEIYDNVRLGVKPLVLFMLDESDEMTYKMLTGPYDPAVTYAGACVTDAYYYVQKRTTSNEDGIFLFVTQRAVFDQGGADDLGDGCARYPYTLLKHRSAKAKFKCTAAATSALNTAGYYDDYVSTKLPWFPNNYGENILFVNDARDHVELSCKSGFPGLVNWDDANQALEVRVFSGNYLNWWFYARTKRIDLLKQQMSTFVRDDLTGVNAGIMRFKRNTKGAYVPFVPVDVDVTKQPLLDTIADFGTTTAQLADGATLSESLHETALYLRGDEPRYGGTLHGGAAQPSHPDVIAGGRYKSPVEFSCQDVHVVVVASGVPTNDDESDNLLGTLPGYTQGTCRNDVTWDWNSPQVRDTCSDNVAAYMANTDIAPHRDGVQPAKMHVVAFDVDWPYLEDISRSGNGEYVRAVNGIPMGERLRGLFRTQILLNSTFTSPAIAVNAFNRLQHLDDLYFGLFSPAQTAHWDGNLKKYRMGRLDDGEIAIVDADDEEAVDLTTGGFDAEARSHWSAAADGNITAFGGAAALLGAGRRIYTDLPAALPLDLAGTAGAAFSTGNAALTRNLFGAPDDATKDKLIQWGHGYDAFGTDPSVLRRRLGDILHSRPVLVTYGRDLVGDVSTVYFATNDGFLHAVNARTGAERFAFIPKRLLLGLKQLRQTTTAGKTYGIDGELVVWRDDRDGDGAIEPDDGDRVLLYFGLGLGGRAYYAMDVTDPDRPELQWRIDSFGTDFAELGLATSDPVVTKVRYGTTVKTALVFAGGYDRGEDNHPPTAAYASGRGVFIIDAETGAPLWRGLASDRADGDELFNEMLYAIPSRIKVIDMNSDGFADRMYVGDLGGQLWRFDQDVTSVDRLSFKGGVIAQLGIQTAGPVSDPEDRRKFFYPPDVVQLQNAYGTFLSINIGSGNRNRPKTDTVTHDYFFSVRDPNVAGPPPGFVYEAVLASQLKDVTADAGASRAAGSVFMDDVFRNHRGWKVALEAGEKVLAEAKTFDEKVLFTSYKPGSAAPSEEAGCQADFGTARFWAVGLAGGHPTEPFGETPEMDGDNRYMELARDDIPPSVTVLFPQIANGQPVTLVGTQRVPIDLGTNRFRTYWHEARK